MAKFKKYDEVKCVKEIDNLIVQVKVGAIGYIDSVRDDGTYVVKFGFWDIGCNDSQIKINHEKE